MVEAPLLSGHVARRSARDPVSRFLSVPPVILALGLIVLIVGGCSGNRSAVLEREPLFDLEIGRLEDQLDLISRDGVMPRVSTSVVMRDGIVYIADGAANKIMEFTSFGDLVQLIYNPQENPEPVTLGGEGASTDGGVVTRTAAEYPFNQLGRIGVDSRRFIYAEDRLTPERSVFDEQLGVQLNRIVIRFDDRGEAVDYIGQEGVGGTPFPFIERIQVTKRDEVVVVASTMDTRFVYLYDPSGELIYTVRIGLDRLPIPAEDADLITVLEELVAGVDAYRIYLKISYYRTAVAEDTGEEHGIDFDHSRVYWLDLASGRYAGFVELPRGTDDGGGEHHELIGVVEGEHIFLLSRRDAGQTRLLIMNDAGRVIRRRTLAISETGLVARSFSLTSDGVLTALLGYPNLAQVAWWRTDRLLPTARSDGDG